MLGYVSNLQKIKQCTAGDLKYSLLTYLSFINSLQDLLYIKRFLDDFIVVWQFTTGRKFHEWLTEYSSITTHKKMLSNYVSMIISVNFITFS